MPAPNARQEVQNIPLQIVGGTKFGRYSKISSEATWNFIVSDNWLVPYAGYKNILTVSETALGRGLYSSFVGNFMIAVVGAIVYKITASPTTDALTKTIVGRLKTNVNDVFIAENNNYQICITDGIAVYVYYYGTDPAEPTFASSVKTGAVAPLEFNFPFDAPGYISFQNTRLIIACTDSTNWVLSGQNAARDWTTGVERVGSIQSKPDVCQAAVPVPGGGNNILVFGRNSIESYQDVGGAFFPYIRSVTTSIDYGCINSASIAHLKTFIVWIAVNEQSGPVLMKCEGSNIESISTDGINFQLGNLSNPENCTGFLYQQDGHVIYQFTFPDDNISYAYDFNTQMFFNVSNEHLNYHIAREVVYFNNKYYFVALTDGNIYDFDTIYTAADYGDDNIQAIPRIRITPPLRLPDQRYYVAKSLGFTIENGQPNRFRTVTTYQNAGIVIDTEGLVNIATEGGTLLTTQGTEAEANATYVTASETVELAISRNGGETYGTFWGKDMNPTGKFKSRFIFQRLGHANDSTYQLRFTGYGRYVVCDGEVSIYQ